MGMMSFEPLSRICPVTGFLTEPTSQGEEIVRPTTIDSLDHYWLHGMLDTEQAITKLLGLVAELRRELNQLQAALDVQSFGKVARLARGEEAADG